MTIQEDCKTFYDDLCKDISSHLLSHKDINNAMSECDKSFCAMNIKSWFSTKQITDHNKNSQKLMSSRTVCISSDAIVTKARRIRIYPTQQQKRIFKQWFGVERKVYNTCINHFNEKDMNLRGG